METAGILIESTNINQKTVGQKSNPPEFEKSNERAKVLGKLSVASLFNACMPKLAGAKTCWRARASDAQGKEESE